MSKNKYKQGKYIVKNTEKYITKDGNLPMCRSGWEYSFCSYLDNNPHVVKWGSECFAIKYYCTVNHKTRRYFIDFFMQMSDGKQFLIEIKPYSQTKKPRASKKKSKKTILYESKTWQNNQDKWKSAEKFASERGMIFKIITEKELYGK